MRRIELAPLLTCKAKRSRPPYLKRLGHQTALTIRAFPLQKHKREQRLFVPQFSFCSKDVALIVCVFMSFRYFTTLPWIPIHSEPLRNFHNSSIYAGFPTYILKLETLLQWFICSRLLK